MKVYPVTLKTALMLVVLIVVLLPVAKAQQNGSLDSKIASVTDLKVPAGGITLQVKRELENGLNHHGYLGGHWRLNWESRLVRNGKEIKIEDWTGTSSFTQLGEQSQYVSASGGQVTLSTDGQALRTTPDGQTEVFEANGHLISRAYHHGNKVVLRYTKDGKLSRVEGPGGSFLAFSFDAAGHVVRVDSSTGASIQYGYDKDNLTQVQINGGSPLRYGYDNKGYLARVEDARYGNLQIAYDSKGRVTSYRHADGSEQRSEYDDASNTKREIAPDGATIVTRESAATRRTEITDPLGNKSAIQFDQAGRPVTVIAPSGASSRMTYDSVGRMVASEDALGHTTRYEYAGDSPTLKAIVRPDTTRQEFEYDEQNNLTAIKIDGKIVSTLAYNSDGTIASAKNPQASEQKFTYYPNGLVKSVANARGETTQFEYDSRGHLIRSTNPLGGITVRGYDSQDRLVTITNPSGGVTRYDYDETGRLVRETDAVGGVTRFEYDARGRLASETNAAGQTTRYEYSAADKLIKTIWPDKTTENYRYDLAGNLVEHTDRLGRTFKFERDSQGRVVLERWPSGLEIRHRYDAAGNLLATDDSSGVREEYQLDVGGRSTTESNSTGGKTQYKYDVFGNLVAVTNPLGRTKQLTRTIDGNLTEVREASGDEASYEYDEAGRVVAIHRPSGSVGRFTYDQMGNLLTATDAFGNAKRYSYDNAGHLISFTDAANRVTQFTYDKAGQRIEKKLPDGKTVTYKYDMLGRMVEADDGAFPVRMSYDDAGNLQRVEYPTIKKVVAYEYDATGLRIRMIAPDGRETRYLYDDLKRLSALSLPDGKTINIGYDEKNRIKSVTYPNGVNGRWEYDTNGQIAKISYHDQSGRPLAATAYRYDVAGNTIESEDAQGRSARFAYDPAGQLTDETNSDGAVKYAYVRGGNRASVTEGKRISQYKHDVADRVIEAGAEQFSYDPNGNLISRKGPGGTTNYEYDFENRLVKVVAPSGDTTTFGYAPTGERVWRRDKSGVTYFLYDGINLIAELDNDLHTRTTYVHAVGIDRPLAMLQEKQNYYYAADRLGSVTHLIDDTGKVAVTYSYDAFGRIKAKQGTVGNPFTYTGRELDSTGLYYFRARYYDATLGRFLSGDLISPSLDEPLDLNPYLYVRNNPMRLVDPFGLTGFPPEFLANQSDQTLSDMYRASSNPVESEQLYTALRSRGMGTPQGDIWHYQAPQKQPDGSVKFVWKPGSPPDVEGVASPTAQPQQQVVGSPGQAGPRNLNPTDTEAVDAGEGAARPAPGAPKNNTLAVGGGRNGGDTIAVAPGAPAGGKGFWTLDPRTVDPRLGTAGTIASIVATAADCYRNGLENCGPKIAGGIVIGGIARGILGKAAGPIGTLVSGGIAWWKIGRELTQNVADSNQRAEQEKARKAQEQANLQNRDAFYGRIEQLKAKIDALKKDHDLVAENLGKASEQATAAKNAAADAATTLAQMRVLKNQKAEVSAEACDQINKAKPIVTEIEGLAAQAEAKQREIDRLLTEGNNLAANCASPADVAAIKDRYNHIKSLLGEINQLKKAADQKNAVVDKTRGLTQSNGAQTPANLTTAIADKAREANEAATQATQLMITARGSVEHLDASKPQLQREIDALHSAAPEALLADIQDQFNALYGRLNSVTEHKPLVPYDDQASADAKRASQSQQEALRIVENWRADTSCQLPSTDAAIQRINTALTMAGMNDPAPMFRQAQVCEASAKCIPLINQSRQLFEQLQIEEGQAAMEQAREAGCNVTGLETALDYYRTVRDAAALLNTGKERCKFQEGIDFAQKIPPSIQNRPAIASAISELRAGAAAQQRVEQLITQATTAADAANSYQLRNRYEESQKQFATADGFVAQATQVAGPYSCLSERVDRYRSEYNKLKDSANNLSGGRATGSGGSNQPTVEQIPEDNPNQSIVKANPPADSSKSPTVEEIPGALDSPNPKSGTGGTNVATNKPTSTSTKPVVEVIPDSLDTGKPASNRNPSSGNTASNNKPVVEDIPPDALDTDKPRVEPSGGNTSSGSTSKSGGSSTENKQASNKPKKEKKPRDPNKPGFWDTLGRAIIAARNPNAGNPPANNPPPNNQPPSNSGGQGNDDLTGTWIMSGRDGDNYWITTMYLQGQGNNEWIGTAQYRTNINPCSADWFVTPGFSATSLKIRVTNPGAFTMRLSTEPECGDKKGQRIYLDWTGTFDSSTMTIRTGAAPYTLYRQ